MPRGKKNVPVVEEIEDFEEEEQEDPQEHWEDDDEEEDTSKEDFLVRLGDPETDEEEGSDQVGNSTDFESLVAETSVYVIETLEQLAEKSKVSNLKKVLDKGDALVEAWEDRLATES